MDPRLGQLLMIGISGPTLTEEEKSFLVKNNIGGVTLFGRNCVDPKQVHALCTELQGLKDHMPNKTPLYIAIDMEGGRVMRLKSPFTAWPPAREWGEKDSTSLSFDFGQAMGEELSAVGINVDWAPSADILTNPKNTAIGDRAFGADSEIVAKHASAFTRGLLKAGVNPCVKHFPGHGNTVVDSHEQLPVEDITLETLEGREFNPFRKVFRARAEMLMTSHILFRQIDPQWPVTLSRKFLHDILREHLRYRGLIITDDLGMKAMSSNYGAEEIPVLALLAGANVLLYCNEPQIPPLALASLDQAQKSGRLSEDLIQASYAMIVEHKKSNLRNESPLSWAEAEKRIGSVAHQKVVESLRSPLKVHDL